MKRWNDYFESMDPKSKKPHAPEKPIDVRNSASVKYFSVYPRKVGEHNVSGRVTPVASHAPHGSHIPRPSHQQPQPTGETSFQGERYTSRPNEFVSVANRTDGGHTNFAWVD